MKKELIRKQFHFKITGVDESKYVISGVFSTGGEDRHGEVVDQMGWKLDEFMQNPVVLFAHDPYQPAVGKVINIGKDANGNLSGDIQFAAEEYPFAMIIYRLYLGGFMRAFSVGFMNDKYEVDQETDTLILRENTLMEISCVNIPANAAALAEQKGIDLTEYRAKMTDMRKAAIPYADHGMAPEDASWDGPGEMSACGDDLGKLKAICAWFDSENADVKSSYKLPHHQADGLKAVWKGVSGAMAALLGARGGVDIPESDRKGVYNHLAKHYAEFEKDVPEFKSYTAEELKAIGDDEVYCVECGAKIEGEPFERSVGENSGTPIVELVCEACSNLQKDKSKKQKSADTGGSAKVKSVETPAATRGSWRHDSRRVRVINRAVRQLLGAKAKLTPRSK